MKGVILRDLFVAGDSFSIKLNRVPIFLLIEIAQGTVIKAPCVDLAVEGIWITAACGLVAVARIRRARCLVHVAGRFEFLPCLGGRGAELG